MSKAQDFGGKDTKNPRNDMQNFIFLAFYGSSYLKNDYLCALTTVFYT